MSQLGPHDDVSPAELKQMIDDNKEIVILDVRQPDEHAHSAFPQAKHIPLGELQDRFEELDAEAEIVVHCKLGGRSARAASFLQGKDFKSVHNLTGGLTAYAKEFDAKLTPK